MATWPTTAAWRSIEHDQLHDRGRPRSQGMTKKEPIEGSSVSPYPHYKGSFPLKDAGTYA